MRFLHLADVHLDTEFRSRSDAVRRALRDASREAFRQAVTLALDAEVHAVLIAGDLFDGERLSFETERFLLSEMERLDAAGIPVIYATGNHDPGRAGLRAHALDWPECVTVVGEAEAVTIPVEDRDGAVVGRVTAAGHETARETRDLAARFPVPEGEHPEIAVLHTQVVGARTADRHDPYAPAELDALRSSGYDYWALGHVHLRQALSEHDPAIHYPGNLQGRNPRETGPKGGLLVDVDRSGAADVAFHPLAPIRWETLAVEGLEAAGSLRELEGLVGDAWDRAREEESGEPGTEWLLRVELDGGSPLHRELAREANVLTLEEELATRIDALDVDVRIRSLHPPVSVDDHRQRQDVLGEALALLEEVREDPETLRVLLPDVLAGVTEGDADDAATYGRELLEGIDGELVARMLEEAGER